MNTRGSIVSVDQLTGVVRQEVGHFTLTPWSVTTRVQGMCDKGTKSLHPIRVSDVGPREEGLYKETMETLRSMREDGIRPVVIDFSFTITTTISLVFRNLGYSATTNEVDSSFRTVV